MNGYLFVDVRVLHCGLVFGSRSEDRSGYFCVAKVGSACRAGFFSWIPCRNTSIHFSAFNLFVDVRVLHRDLVFGSRSEDRSGYFCVAKVGSACRARFLSWLPCRNAAIHFSTVNLFVDLRFLHCGLVFGSRSEDRSGYFVRQQSVPLAERDFSGGYYFETARFVFLPSIFLLMCDFFIVAWCSAPDLRTDRATLCNSRFRLPSGIFQLGALPKHFDSFFCRQSFCRCGISSSWPGVRLPF